MRLKHCPKCDLYLTKQAFSSTRAKYCLACKRIKELEQQQEMRQRAFNKLTTKKDKKQVVKSLGAIQKNVQAKFNAWIRERDKDKPCISCGQVKDKYHAGHFIAQGFSGFLKYNEDNCHKQCLTKHSKVRLFNGLYKTINKIKIGDKLWGFNEKTFEKEICIVEEVDFFIPKELYMVELNNGDVFFATPDHMVVVNNKWVKIEDMLHKCTDYDILEL